MKETIKINGAFGEGSGQIIRTKFNSPMSLKYVAKTKIKYLQGENSSSALRKEWQKPNYSSLLEWYLKKFGLSFAEVADEI